MRGARHALMRRRFILKGDTSLRENHSEVLVMRVQRVVNRRCPSGWDRCDPSLSRIRCFLH